MKHSPRISIIIPVYNCEKYLHRCLDSILVQTFRDWECILIDDGSTDLSGKILDDYTEKDQRFIEDSTFLCNSIHFEYLFGKMAY